MYLYICFFLKRQAYMAIAFCFKEFSVDSNNTHLHDVNLVIHPVTTILSIYNKINVPFKGIFRDVKAK